MPSGVGDDITEDPMRRTVAVAIAMAAALTPLPTLAAPASTDKTSGPADYVVLIDEGASRAKDKQAAFSPPARVSAGTLALLNPSMTLIYVPGAGTEASGDG